MIEPTRREVITGTEAGSEVIITPAGAEVLRLLRRLHRWPWNEPPIEIYWPGFAVRSRPFDQARDA